MPDELYVLLVVKNISDVFDAKEALTAFHVVGMFLDKEIADLLAIRTANTMSHGDRIVVIGCKPLESLGFTETLVVVDGKVN